jgi:hypothetical protein
VKRVLIWQRLDTVGVEYAEIALDPLRLEGEVVLVEEGKACAISYRVECDEEGRTAKAQVNLRCDGSRSALTLVRRADGSWMRKARRVPGIDGLDDIDLSVTPSTNTPPLRRLHLDVGQSAEVTAAWIQVPSLEIAPLLQKYHRVTAATYVYEAAALGFRAELVVDETGIVRSYGGLWKALVV